MNRYRDATEEWKRAFMETQAFSMENEVGEGQVKQINEMALMG